jgi:hypothetical protein
MGGVMDENQMLFERAPAPASARIAKLKAELDQKHAQLLASLREQYPDCKVASELWDYGHVYGVGVFGDDVRKAWIVERL